MQLQSNNYNPQFGARYIANCQGLKLYKLTDRNDLKFLRNLQGNINMAELMPNLSKQETDRWHEMLEYAVINAHTPGNTTYIETCNNKPCGIITYSTNKNTTSLDCICTWPIETGKKVAQAGKTLFYQLFKDFQELHGKKIKLEAITNGPYNTVNKYEQLGFKKTSNVHPTKIEMEIPAPKVKETQQKLSNIIDYEPMEGEKVNLITELD